MKEYLEFEMTIQNFSCCGEVKATFGEELNRFAEEGWCPVWQTYEKYYTDGGVLYSIIFERRVKV
mgnify:CR=1 FL=1